MPETIEVLAEELKKAEHKAQSKKSDANIWSLIGASILLLHVLMPESSSGICAIEPFMVGVIGYCWIDYGVSKGQVSSLEEEIIECVKSST